MLGHRSLEKTLCDLFQFQSTKQLNFLTFDTNNLLLFLESHENSPLGIFFLATVLYFLVFVAQTTRLIKRVEPLEPERTRCC